MAHLAFSTFVFLLLLIFYLLNYYQFAFILYFLSPPDCTVKFHEGKNLSILFTDVSQTPKTVSGSESVLNIYEFIQFGSWKAGREEM